MQDQKINGKPSFLQTLIFRKKEIGMISLAVFAGAGILIGYLRSGPSAEAYAHAEAIFEKWAVSPQDETLYLEMKKAVRMVPALEKKYQAVIAQNLLNSNQTEEAIPMARETLNRLKEEAPFHAAYAKTSLLIAQGSYQEAFERAVALKEEMGNPPNLKLLYAHNLIRIAVLLQELKNRPGEKAAWGEFEDYLQKEPSLSALVLGSFSKGYLDFTQYIAERKKQI